MGCDGRLFPCDGHIRPVARTSAVRPWSPLGPNASLLKNPSDFIHTLSPRAILLPPSVPHGWPGPTELWLAEGGEFRFAGAVPAGRELAKLVPGQRGGLSHRGGWHKGVSREWPEPVASPSGRAPAASDPHGLRGRPGPRAMRRHPGRRPDTSLPRPADGSVRRGWERAGSLPKGANATKPPRACVEHRWKEGRPAPGRRGCPSPVGRG
jgi:hypothetical protein